MMRNRSALLNRLQASISARVRPHPMQSAEIGSSVHTLLQGLSMPLMIRHENMLRQDKDASAEGNRPWRAALRPASRWPPRSAGRGAPGRLGRPLTLTTPVRAVLGVYKR
jgi:hypothetical protein